MKLSESKEGFLFQLLLKLINSLCVSWPANNSSSIQTLPNAEHLYTVKLRVDELQKEQCRNLRCMRHDWKSEEKFRDVKVQVAL